MIAELLAFTVDEVMSPLIHDPQVICEFEIKAMWRSTLY
jgi:hypothetical protein